MPAVLSAAADRGLTEAARRLDAQDPAGALDALLIGWRRARSEALSERIHVLGGVLGRVLPKIEGENPSHRHEQWLACAAEGRAVDQVRLSHGFERAPMTRISARLRWLAGQPADPRWTAHVIEVALAHVLDYWPELSPSPRRVWRRCCAILRDLRDPASLSHLRGQHERVRLQPDGRGAAEAAAKRIEALAAQLQAIEPGATASDAAIEAFDAAFARWRTSPAPSPDELLRPRTDDRGAGLLELIYAAPDDVDLRRVYADWLETTAAPRAQLMQLQFQQHDAPRPTKARAREIAQLIDRYGGRWLGPLAPFVREVEWRLGFPHAANLVFRGKAQRDAALAHPAWQTFRVIHTRDPGVVTHPNLAGVVQIGRASPVVSCQSRITPIGEGIVDSLTQPIGCQRLVIEANALRGLKRDAWPALTRIDVDAAFAGDLSHVPLAALNVDQLMFWQIHTDAIGPVAGRCAGVPWLGFDGSWGFRYVLDRRGEHPTLTVIWRHARECEWPERAVPAVRALGVRRVRIASPGYTQPAEVLAAWRDGLAPAAVTLPRARRVRAKR